MHLKVEIKVYKATLKKVKKKKKSNDVKILKREITVCSGRGSS